MNAFGHVTWKSRQLSVWVCYWATQPNSTIIWHCH